MGLYNISESEDMVDASIGKDDGKKPKQQSKHKNDKATDGENPIVELKGLCTAKSTEGKLADVQAILKRVTGVMNPNAIKDETKAIDAIEEIKKL